MVDWGIACLLAATAGPKSVAWTMGAANCAAVLLSVPISYHFLRLYSATGRACRRKWRYIKYTPLLFTFYLELVSLGHNIARPTCSADGKVGASNCDHS